MRAPIFLSRSGSYKEELYFHPWVYNLKVKGVCFLAIPVKSRTNDSIKYWEKKVLNTEKQVLNNEKKSIKHWEKNN